MVSDMSDRVRMDINIINMRFEYSDTDTVSDVEYPIRIRTDLNSYKRIRSQIHPENICIICTLISRKILK
jgi:hypothetical protein